MTSLAKACSESLGVLFVILGLLLMVITFTEINKHWKKADRPETKDPHFLRAMEELDDIDRILGLLPPKPPSTQQMMEEVVREALPKAIGPVKMPPRYVGTDFWRRSFEEEVKREAEKAKKLAELECHCMVCDKPGIHTHWVQEPVEVRCADGTAYMIGNQFPNEREGFF